MLMIALVKRSEYTQLVERNRIFRSPVTHLPSLSALDYCELPLSLQGEGSLLTSVYAAVERHLVRVQEYAKVCLKLSASRSGVLWCLLLSAHTAFQTWFCYQALWDLDAQRGRSNATWHSLSPDA